MENIDKLLYCFMAKVKDSTVYEDLHSRLYPNRRFGQSLPHTYYVLKQTS